MKILITLFQMNSIGAFMNFTEFLGLKRNYNLVYKQIELRMSLPIAWQKRV